MYVWTNLFGLYLGRIDAAIEIRYCNILHFSKGRTRFTHTHTHTLLHSFKSRGLADFVRRFGIFHRKIHELFEMLIIFVVFLSDVDEFLSAIREASDLDLQEVN